MESKRKILLKDISDLELSPFNIERKFRHEKKSTIYTTNPWEEFLEDTSIHLGKRSGGWKFCWNFHDDKYYKNKEELLHFIRTGIIVDEYGDIIDNEEFITMALEWGQPDGWDTQTYYKKNLSQNPWNIEKYYDKYIDGLRVSNSTEFS
jgi:hypothetical protein